MTASIEDFTLEDIKAIITTLDLVDKLKLFTFLLDEPHVSDCAAIAICMNGNKFPSTQTANTIGE